MTERRARQPSVSSVVEISVAERARGSIRNSDGAFEKHPGGSRGRAEAERLTIATGLDGLRRARKLAQVEIAAQLRTNQGYVSRLENQTDLYVGTLRRFIHALGGELHITVKFADATEPIELEFFGDIERPIRDDEEHELVNA